MISYVIFLLGTVNHTTVSAQTKHAGKLKGLVPYVGVGTNLTGGGRGAGEGGARGFVLQ